MLETDGSGATQASYMLGDGQVLAEARSGTSSYSLYDGQGSVRALTNSSGVITDQYTYDAFGNLQSSSGSTVNPYRYTGQQFDSLTGLYDLRARYYDPTTGRFISRDTAGIDVSNPVELDRSSYVQENLVNLADPAGHFAVEMADRDNERPESGRRLTQEEAERATQDATFLAEQFGLVPDAPNIPALQEELRQALDNTGPEEE